MAKHMMVTGATSGIGREIAIMAADQGYNLSLCGRDKVRLEQTWELLPEQTQTHNHIFCASETATVQLFAKEAQEKLGAVDVLVNCAGLNNVRAPGHEVSIDDLHWLMKINCYAPIAFMQSVIPNMKAKKSGAIVNILSTVCQYSNPGIAAYTASKTALDSYTKVMRKELREDKIKMLSLYPGGVDTAFRPADRPEYLTAQSVAKAAMQMLDYDEDTHIHDLIIRPTSESNF